MVETTEATRAPSALERRETPALQRRGAGELVTDQGKTAIADSVVAKVAAIAAREIPGVYDMGSGTARAFGAIRERIPLAGNTGLTRGVKVEVGERQAAIDIDLVVEYGMSIVDVSQGVRSNVIDRLQGTTGLEVKEVNIFVDDIWTGEEKNEEPRVE